MFKLIWNTANLSDYKPYVNEPSNIKVIASKWGVYHEKNSKKWIFSLLSNVNFEVINQIENIKKEDKLIIVDSSVEKKKEFYSKLNLICSNFFLFHLGDETGGKESLPIYNLSSQSWRTFCSNIYFSSNKTECIPLGPKSGIEDINIKRRKYKWAWTGTIHKSSRHDLLYQLEKIEPFFIHKTKKFSDNTSLNTEKMSEILSNTEFLPCANGIVHPETYRLYEALECGCIPIVENAFRYFDRLYPNNPFIKVDKWIEAKDKILKYNQDEIISKRDECRNWWKNYKIYLQKKISKKLINAI